jgi:hypothetical protein
MTKGIQHLDHVPMIRLSGEINPIWDHVCLGGACVLCLVCACMPLRVSAVCADVAALTIRPLERS